MTSKKQTYAEEAKNLITLNRDGVLSTISLSQKGYPFGSIVPYDIDKDGNLIIYISLIAEHYKNLKADSRASLIVLDSFGTKDRQAHARATILLDFSVVPEQQKEQVQFSYEKRFPQSINYEIQHNFLFMRGNPVKIRWIGGFGDITWISREDFTSVPFDPVTYGASDIMQHMNEDHKDALQHYVKTFSSFDPNEFDVQLTAVNSNDFTLTLKKGKKEEKLKISFPSKLKSRDDARQAFIALLKTNH